MIIRLIALLLVAPACLAQTNESPTTSTPLNDIPALTAQANQGNVDAQLKIADAYLRGSGVTQNDKEGFRWFLMAAEKGNAEAQYAVGSLYAIGRGVSRDDVEATK
jgi:TPR repeat protein